MEGNGMPVAANGCHLRKSRFSESGRVYLLTAVTYQRKPVFADWRMGRLLVEQLRSAEETTMVASMAWVVMPDHLHWLVELQQGSLAGLMCGDAEAAALRLRRAQVGSTL
jgi:REP element-mobilizing transposase RayT